jgi:hypothetical protein
MDWSWWLFLTSIASIVLTWMIGDGKHWAWLPLGALNVPWSIYGIVTRQPGFIALGILYLVVQSRNAFVPHSTHHPSKGSAPSEQAEGRG